MLTGVLFGLPCLALLRAAYVAGRCRSRTALCCRQPHRLGRTRPQDFWASACSTACCASSRSASTTSGARPRCASASGRPCASTASRWNTAAPAASCSAASSSSSFSSCCRWPSSPFWRRCCWGTKGADRGGFESAALDRPVLAVGLSASTARGATGSRAPAGAASAAALSGRSAPFAWTYLWTTVLIPLTLGWILPWRAAKLQRALFNETCFGDKAFAFTGRAGPLYKRFWLVWVSAIVLFGAALAAIGAVLGSRPVHPGGGPPAHAAPSRARRSPPSSPSCSPRC